MHNIDILEIPLLYFFKNDINPVSYNKIRTIGFSLVFGILEKIDGNFIFLLSRTFGRRVLGRNFYRVRLIYRVTLWVGNMSFRIPVSRVNSWVNMQS